MATRGMKKHKRTTVTESLVMRAAPGASIDEPDGLELMSGRDISTRGLSLRADSVNESERSVEAVLSTETPATVIDWERERVINEVLVSTGMRSAGQVVLLESHSRWSLEAVLGSVRSMVAAPGAVTGRLYLARNDARADMAWNKVSQRHITDVSVGYRADEYTDIAPGETKEVAGRSWNNPGPRTLRITTAWTLREVSLVPIGADQFAKIRGQQTVTTSGVVAPGQTRTGGCRKETVMNFEQWLRSRAIDPAGLTTERRAELLAEFQRATADVTPAPVEPAPVVPAPVQQRTAASDLTPVVDPAEVARNAIQAERQRVSSIRQLAGSDVSGELVERAISEGWDQARAGVEFLTHMRSSRTPTAGTGPAVISRSHDADCTERALGVSLAMRCGVRWDAAPADSSDSMRQTRAREAEQADRYRDMSLLDICREACRLAGRSVPFGRDETIRTAISTASLSNIFTTSVNALLMQAYAEAGDSTAGWVREVEVADFKVNDRIQLGKSSGLEKLPRGKTADHASRGDGVESYAIARYAKQFVVDEQDIIDDSLNAILDMPNEMGAAARRLRPDLVYAILLANAALGQDSVALFEASSHINLLTGALSAANLEAGIVAMGKQTQGGVNLNIMPAFLIVPQDLRFTADIILSSSQRIISTASNGTANPLQGLLQTRVDNRIGVAGVTDPASGTAYAGLATNWFLAASPTVCPTIEVGYLRGTGRAPQLRSFVLDKGQWGIGWDVKMDIGAKALDYRGLFKSTGAG